MPGEPGTARRTNRRAEPCPGSESPPVSSPLRLSDENSRGKVQNVRVDSSDFNRSPDVVSDARPRDGATSWQCWTAEARIDCFD
jgi:hypothetical protein